MGDSLLLATKMMHRFVLFPIAWTMLNAGHQATILVIVCAAIGN